MKPLLGIVIFLAVIASANTVFAHDEHSEPENRIGQMSEDVIRARLQQLGYTQPTSMTLQNNALQMIQSDRRVIPTEQYEVTTFKDGRSVQLSIDRLSGKIEEIQERKN